MNSLKGAIKRLSDPKVRNTVIAISLVIATVVIVYDLVIRPKL
jgi:hypothetical protein